MGSIGVNFQKFNTHSDSHERAFEAFCNHLFERFFKRTSLDWKDFKIINGAGGDGGIEAYGINKNNKKFGIQAKWYPKSLGSTQLNAIKKSVLTAIAVHPDLAKVIIAIPRNLAGKKFVKTKPVKSARAKKVTSNSEQIRFNKCVSDIKSLHPKLSIEFWGQHELERECMLNENVGIRSYWFDQTAIDFSHLVHRFEVAKHGWLAIRYIADLHTIGFIQQSVSYHLRKPEVLQDHVQQHRHYQSALLEIDYRLSQLIPLDVDDIILNFRASIKNLHDQVESLIVGTNRNFPNLPVDFQIIDDKTFLKEFGRISSTPPSNLRPKVEEFPVYLQRYRFDRDRKYLRLFALESHPQYLVFIGNPGTGKTHALTNTVETSLAENIPAVIVPARDCPATSLASILQYGMDAFHTWTENEILSALESLAYLSAWRNVNIASQNSYRPKAIICIDGIDEAPVTTWPVWRIRINELATYVKKFPGIQFIVSFRKSFETNEIKWNDENRIYHLPDSGDIPVHKLFPIYAERYQTPHAGWIGYALSDLISLRLFCEVYTDKRHDQNLHIGTSLTQLIRRKIELIEGELARKLNRHLQREDELLLKVLTTLTRSLAVENKIQRSDLIQLIIQQTNSMLNATEAGVAISLLRDYGVITEVKESGDEIKPTAYSYHVFHQSLIEFVLAKQFVHLVTEQKETLVPSELLERPGVVQITSDILAADHGIVPKLVGLWSNLPDFRLTELALTSIASLPQEKAEKYKDWGKSEFIRSSRLRNLILKLWIVPSARNPESTFNALFLHDILSGFSTTAERDIIWSGPGYYDGRDFDRIPSVLESITLDEDDEHNGLPLVLAWSLTCLDNTYREKTKTKLALWASENLQKATSLIKLLFLKYDPQLDEDLSLVLLGAVSIQRSHTDGLAELTNYLLDEVFTLERIRAAKNIIVRQACRSVIEKCNTLQPIEPARLNKCRPPYDVPFEKIPLDLGETSGDGRYPIRGDLAWYVIQRSYRGFLEYPVVGHQQEPFINAFFSQYPEVEGRHFEFAVSAAIAYIRFLGWLRTDGHSMTEATHGILSTVSTFEEKYTWLAVHYIKGYLADNLPYRDDHDRIGMATDYVYFTEISNPANTIEGGIIFPKIVAGWILPTDLSPTLKLEQKNLKKDIKDWVEEDHPFDFKSWHILTNTDLKSVLQTQTKNWIVLKGYTSLAEPSQYCRGSINTVAFIINRKDFPSFLKTVQASGLYHLQDFDVNSLDTKSYAGSAIDAIWMDWIEEYYPSFDFNGIEIVKTVCEVDSKKDGETMPYHVPSRTICHRLDIYRGDGHVFLSRDEQIVAFNTVIGEPHHDRQELFLADRDKLSWSLAKGGKMIIWSVFRYQSTTPKTSKKQRDFHWQNCRLSFVWQQGKTFKEHVYHVGWARNSETDLDKRREKTNHVTKSEKN